jgi:hypothetical protein
MNQTIQEATLNPESQATQSTSCRAILKIFEPTRLINNQIMKEMENQVPIISGLQWSLQKRIGEHQTCQEEEK